MDSADALSRANIAYRRPDLYDALTADDDTADVIARTATIRSGRTPAGGGRTVLDLGCGTGRDLAALHDSYGWHVTGVDLQPQLVAYARTVRPDLDVCTGDLRTIRLGRTFDVVTCLGNTLAYLHADDDLDAAAATFAAHAHPGTTLVVTTLTEAPLRSSTSAHGVSAAGFRASVEACSTPDPSGRFLTTRRRWTFPDTTTTTDEFTRRIIGTDELQRLLRAHDFTSFEAGPPCTATFGPAARHGPSKATGPP